MIVSFWPWPSSGILLLCLLLSCAPASTDQASPTLVRTKALISGSATVFPLARQAANQLQSSHPEWEFLIEAIGSDAGLERLTMFGDTDVALSSRPIRQAERQGTALTGQTLLEFKIAWDALTVVVPQSNRFVDQLSSAELVRLFSTAQTWSQVRSAWPNRPIYRLILGNQSGSTEVFADRFLGGDKAKLWQTARSQFTEDTSIQVRGLTATPDAVGYVSASGWKGAESSLRALPIDGVAPTEANVRRQTYPLARPLYLYTTSGALRHNPAVAALCLALLQAPDLIRAEGFYPLTAAEQAENLGRWQRALEEKP